MDPRLRGDDDVMGVLLLAFTQAGLLQNSPSATTSSGVRSMPNISDMRMR